MTSTNPKAVLYLEYFSHLHEAVLKLAHGPEGADGHLGVADFDESLNLTTALTAQVTLYVLTAKRLSRAFIDMFIYI